MKVDFDAIKAATDIVSVIAGYGVKFKKRGKDYVGLCPFHDEKTPSFHVTPTKRLFHSNISCRCQDGGGRAFVIGWPGKARAWTANASCQA
jgi:hypothetical protein